MTSISESEFPTLVLWILHLWCFYWFPGLQISCVFPLPSPLIVVVHGVPPAYLLLLLNAGGSSRTLTARNGKDHGGEAQVRLLVGEAALGGDGGLAVSW